jgi:hypothetical protein
MSAKPEPGTMPSPGEFCQDNPAAFTAIYQRFEVAAMADK